MLHYVLAVLLPPIAVFLWAGSGREFLISMIFSVGFPGSGLLLVWALGWSKTSCLLCCLSLMLIGSLHAVWVVASHKRSSIGSVVEMTSQPTIVEPVPKRKVSGYQNGVLPTYFSPGPMDTDAQPEAIEQSPSSPQHRGKYSPLTISPYSSATPNSPVTQI